jgi:uncharacterized membrane protein YeiH
VLYYLGLLGMTAFSVTGVLAAGKRDMDLFSIVLIGVVTAVGGGTLRDIILDTHPIFWVADLTYLWASVIAAITTFFCVRIFSRLIRLFQYIDALGLALFVILAMEKTTSLGYGNTIAVLMGLITGITGGIVRDILTDRIPLVLGKEFYATPALLGAIMLLLLNHYFPTHEYNKLYAISIIIILRILAIQWGLYYPKWLMYGGQENN